MEVAQEQISSLLRRRHRLPPGRDDDFNIFNQKEIADTVNSISKVITLLLGAVAGISLLVGGIGIMNIMLVSVTERTREVGLRIAVGAQASHIRLQFLIEAITLSLFGGLIGALLGVAASKLVGVVADFKAVVSVGSILLAFSVSSAIGIFFGFYPATKAAAFVADAFANWLPWTYLGGARALLGRLYTLRVRQRFRPRCNILTHKLLRMSRL